jgi:hypothetical protein
LLCVAEVEQLRSLAIAPHAVAQFVGRPAIELETAPGKNHAIFLARLASLISLRATSLRVRSGSRSSGSPQPPPPAVRNITRSPA